MKNTKSFKFFLAFTLMLSATGTILQPQANASSSPRISITINNIDATLSHDPMKRSGRVYVPLRDLGTLLSLHTSWNPNTKSIQVLGVGQEILLRSNDSKAMVNGKSIKIDAPPIVKQGVTYVPLQLFASVLKVPLTWNAKTNTVSANYTSPYLYTSVQGTPFWFHKKDGTLYMSTGSKPLTVGKTSMDIKEISTFTAAKLDAKSYLLQIHDNYGEPHINDVVFRAIVHKEKLALSSKVSYWGHHNHESIEKAGDLIVMIDGKTLKLADAKGTVKASYQAKDLFGEEDNFTVEGAFDGYLHVRPYQKGTLQLLNTKTKESVLLYKELLSEQDKEIIDTMIKDGATGDSDYAGDRLSFVKKEGKTLYFNRNENSHTYQLK
ncbi:copper amine oxidase N-terminal domain-containing protein [Paenibacillus sp.]|uniref:copper amine oxidase N-terminal domain-containing protein n=1 Tax=Paenibacillus sp. TaxID=58172 RepID=UPI003463EB98